MLDLLAFSKLEPVSFSQSPPYSSSRSTAPLPPEVFYASNGTRVRGRFSARHSGHGVGGGGDGWHGIESHPFHHAPVAEADSTEADSANEAETRASWEPVGGPGEPVMTGAIQEFLAAGGGPRSQEGLRERLREEQRKRTEEQGWAHKGYRWFCMACCAWDVDDGSRMFERRAAASAAAHGGGSSGYRAESSMTY